MCEPEAGAIEMGTCRRLFGRLRIRGCLLAPEGCAIRAPGREQTLHRDPARLHGAPCGFRAVRLPVALRKGGDPVAIGIGHKPISRDVGPAVVEQRRLRRQAPPPPFATGVMAKCIRLVSSAAEGATTSRVF